MRLARATPMMTATWRGAGRRVPRGGGACASTADADDALAGAQVRCAPRRPRPQQCKQRARASFRGEEAPDRSAGRRFAFGRARARGARRGASGEVCWIRSAVHRRAQSRVHPSGARNACAIACAGRDGRARAPVRAGRRRSAKHTRAIGESALGLARPRCAALMKLASPSYRHVRGTSSSPQQHATTPHT